ncbi:hypothetical protein JTZ10_21480 [Gordonia rubripertincta]|uniref:Uncharacterized protein n=1 Tax=Gordonia rubripertincta TaxID=36822 RepID=A0AAW4GBB1_GORRU|nr:hypothetical protein [Gordonia rubripertincta]MBM7280319.1 hypothetical protein [Gordonia rubripertincta]QMU19309.1 hypothetical protein H3V45_14530 [Gordonia rubripertincta]
MAKNTTTGRRLRADGTSAVVAADVAIHRGYGDHVRAALDELIKSGKQFTADDVRARIPEDVAPHSANVLPAIIGGYAAAHRIVSVGMTRPARPSRRYSRNLVWVRGDAA